VHTHLLRAALAATVVLLPVRSEAQPTSTGTRPPHATAQAFVGELFAHRQELSLTRPQVDSLTALASRIRADRSRLQTAGLDRVPGKSVPRFARVYPVRRAARAWRSAFRPQISAWRPTGSSTIASRRRRLVAELVPERGSRVLRSAPSLRPADFASWMGGSGCHTTSQVSSAPRRRFSN
jgi:hypothetical protein